MHVDPVQPSLPTTSGRCRERLDHLGDVGDTHLGRDAADHRVRDGARGDLRRRLLRPGRGARVVDLLEHRHPVRTHPRGQLSVERDAVVAVQRHHARSVGVNPCGLERAQRHPTRGSCLVVGDELLPRQQSPVRRADDAVLDRQRPDLQRGEQMLVVTGHAIPLGGLGKLDEESSNSRYCILSQFA